jgi:sec-independent protein translocase protein TatA
MLSTPDVLVILVIVLVLFGGKRIGDLGAGLAKGIRNFKKGLEGEDEAIPKRLEDEPRKSEE